MVDFTALNLTRLLQEMDWFHPKRESITKNISCWIDPLVNVLSCVLLKVSGKTIKYQNF